MSPERLTDRKYKSAYSDMYAFGVIMLLMFSKTRNLVQTLEGKDEQASMWTLREEIHGLIDNPPEFPGSSTRLELMENLAHAWWHSRETHNIKACEFITPTVHKMHGIAGLIAALLMNEPERRPLATHDAMLGNKDSYFLSGDGHVPTYWTKVRGQRPHHRVIPVTDAHEKAALWEAIKPRRGHQFGLGVDARGWCVAPTSS